MTALDCGHIEFITLPPTTEFLIEHVTDINPDLSIDRTIPRCKLCDLIRTTEQAEKEDHGFTESTWDHVRFTGQRISDDEYDPEMKASLVICPPTMINYREVVRKTQIDAQLAIWKKYWGIWGHVDGPDREDEIIGDGGLLWSFEETGEDDDSADEKEQLHERDWDVADDITPTQDLFDQSLLKEEPVTLQIKEEEAKGPMTGHTEAGLRIKGVAGVKKNIESKERSKTM